MHRSPLAGLRTLDGLRGQDRIQAAQTQGGPPAFAGRAKSRAGTLRPCLADARPQGFRTWLGASLLALLAGCGEPPAPLAPAPQASALPGADIARGRELIARQGCVSCHTIPGIRGPGARVGPSLHQVADRAYLGGVLANTPENLVRWLRDPPAIAPHTAMPNVGLSEAQARDIAAYLLTLR